MRRDGGRGNAGEDELTIPGVKTSDRGVMFQFPNLNNSHTAYASISDHTLAEVTIN